LFNKSCFFQSSKNKVFFPRFTYKRGKQCIFKAVQFNKKLHFVGSKY
jgi:hypothetical protein